MTLIISENPEKAKQEIKKAKTPIIVRAADDSFNRKLLEYGKFQVLLSPENGKRTNTIRQINSGMNHVLAKIASKNNVAIGIDLKELKKLSVKEKIQRISKIIQNIKICQKARANLAINGDKREAFHFLLSLGASSQEAKKAIEKSF